MDYTQLINQDNADLYRRKEELRIEGDGIDKRSAASRQTEERRARERERDPLNCGIQGLNSWAPRGNS